MSFTTSQALYPNKIYLHRFYLQYTSINMSIHISLRQTEVPTATASVL